MNLPDKMQYVTDLAKAQFIEVDEVTAIVPVQLVSAVDAAAPAFDWLAPTALHIYFLENITVIRTLVIAGNSLINMYDITPTLHLILSTDILNVPQVLNHIFISRLSYVPNGATGSFSIAFNGFELTYTS